MIFYKYPEIIFFLTFYVIPYVLRTHLLDSYYCLPERPDMAFTFLWKCINNTYSNYQRKFSTEVKTKDAILLQNMSDVIANRLSVKIATTETIGSLIFIN